MDRAEREEHLRKQAQSGLTIREYSERASIPVSRFYSWLKDARRRGKTEPRGRFVPVTSEASTPIEIALPSGVKIKIGPSTDTEAFRHILEVLNACTE